MNDDGPGTRGAVPRTVLVLDDEAGLRFLIERTLRANGYQVLGAADAHEAFEILDTHPGPIDAILCDLVLPGLAGREAAIALVARRPEAKVLYTSGYSPEDSFPGGHSVEGLPFLAKPFEIGQLLRALEELLAPE